ncbi:MAG: helix-turn-helix domain-containing protein [Planctomycetota bacterium]|nr:helix-turn-helix domain-containing protein [Planctomycetota bacterium]
MARPISHPKLQDVQLHEIMHALADPVRLEIVRLAARHPELPCNRFFDEIPKSTMSHHWRVLRQAGLIRQVGHGASRLNSLRTKELEERFPGLLAFVLRQRKTR